RSWWRSRRAMKEVMTEYEKLLAYWLVERWTIEPCGGLGRRPEKTAGMLPDGVPDERRELALGVHLAHDVATTHELATHEHLRNGRRVRVGLDALALLRLRQDVDRLERHADLVQHLHGRGGESAHRKPGRALHVDHDGVLFHFLVDLGQHVAHRTPPSASV